MPDLSTSDFYEWPDDYFRSERVFRVARSTNNLYRQMRLVKGIRQDALWFESAVISMSGIDPKDVPVNYTNYKLLDRKKDLEFRRNILASILTPELLPRLREAANGHCDSGIIDELVEFYSKDPTLASRTPEELEHTYLQLVVLYSRIPVSGYVAKILNDRHFGAQSNARFFLVHATRHGESLPPVSIWACTPREHSTWEVTQPGEPIPQKGDLDDFFMKHLLRVVRQQKLLGGDDSASSAKEEHNYIAIPVHTLHPSLYESSAGTFLGWLFVTCSPWHHELSAEDIKENIQPLVNGIWPLLDDYASSLLDGEIEERLANFGRITTSNPLQYVKNEISSLSGWICDHDDPRPSEVGATQFYRSDGETLLLVLKAAQPGSEAVAIRLNRKPSTIPPANEALLKHGSKRFCQRIRSFYEQVGLRQKEKEAAKLAGRAQEVRFQFMATSHELKKLVYLIPLALAQNKPFILERFPAVLLTFSLPAASKLSPNDRQYLPPAICGFKTANRFEPCIDYFEWLTELVRLSAEIQTIVMPGKSRDMASSAEQFETWKSDIVAHFAISHDFVNKPLPTDFSTRCLLGVCLICAMRNIIQHSFSYDNAAEDLWKYRWQDPIKLELDHSSQFPNWDSEVIAMRNTFEPTKADEAVQEDGTNGAITFYLSQIQHHIGREDTLPFFNAPFGSVYQCLLPFIQQ